MHKLKYIKEKVRKTEQDGRVTKCVPYKIGME